MKYRRVFISGTNTEVGKTFITLNIIKLLESRGKIVNPYKPIETGCKRRSAILIPKDSTIFYNAIKKRISLDQINPYRFLEPISPATAIKRARKKIYISDYNRKLQKYLMLILHSLKAQEDYVLHLLLMDLIYSCC